MSPTVFRKKGFRFFFFSREEKRIHIHVVSNDGEAKFWLLPELTIAKSYKFSNKQLNEIESIIKEHNNEFIIAWKEYFGG